MKKNILALGLMIIAFAGFGSPAALSLFNQANSLYSRGRFEQAISFYQQALQSGIQNSDLYYNLGNAYYKTGDLGRAALCWRRAERLNPADPDLRANLELTGKMISEHLPVPAQSSLTDFWRRVRDLGSAQKWGTRFSIFIWGFWLSLFLYLIFSARRMKRILLGLNLILVLLTLAAGAGFGFRYHWEQEPAGVVLQKNVPARSGPGENFSLLFELPAGARVLIRECGSGYCKVEFPPGMIGWVEGKTIERI